MNAPTVAVFRGGVSPEREVSLDSGRAAFEALRGRIERVEDFVIETREVPAGVSAQTHVVFSMLHGIFGEDGGMQRLLEQRSIEFAGCDAASSAFCFDKLQTKQKVAAAGVPVAPGGFVRADEASRAASILEELGPAVVVKPNCQGSSVGLTFVKDAVALAAAIEAAGEDGSLVEKQIVGREVTVGILDGEPMAVVEIVPKSGRFDYASKYTKGLTDYIAPAALPAMLTEKLREHARQAFNVCGCRDFARIDFMIDGNNQPVFLEINTLPGLMETSLLPMSAKCEGIDFAALLLRMITPAINRYEHARAKTLSSLNRS